MRFGTKFKVVFWIPWLVLVLTLVACEKKNLNNDLEGHWQLERFTIIETGEVIQCERIYYGITRYVTEVAHKVGAKDEICFVARTAYLENQTQLELTDFKVCGYNTDFEVDASVGQMRAFGIINPKRTVFQVEECSHKHLVLVSDYARLELKRF